MFLFSTKAGIVDLLRNLPDNSVVEIDTSQSTYIDGDVLDVIQNFKATAKKPQYPVGPPQGHDRQTGGFTELFFPTKAQQKTTGSFLGTIIY